VANCPKCGSVLAEYDEARKQLLCLRTDCMYREKMSEKKVLPVFETKYAGVVVGSQLIDSSELKTHQTLIDGELLSPYGFIEVEIIRLKSRYNK